MDLATQLEHLRHDADALLAACLADPTAAVPSCPGWDRAALLVHLATVHAWVRAQLALGPDERIRLSEITPPRADDALAGGFAAGVGELLEGLAAMDLTATWPTWSGPLPGTFFPRRMMHETAVHRHDADPVPIEPAIAVDGVDEFLELFAPRIPADRLADVRGALHLHATDADGEWLVHLGADGITFEHGHAKGDVALRGTASDLLLWAWNRAPVDDRFEVFGDTSLLEAWRTAVAI